LAATIGTAITARSTFAVLESRAAAARRTGPNPWTTTNYRGAEVSLRAGHAAALASILTVFADATTPRRVKAAAVIACSSAAIAGAVDDRHGDDSARGVLGHLRAAGRGELTTGAIKVIGIGASSLVAGCLAARGSLWRKAAAGAVVAASANLANLLDLRPGRAAKAMLLVATPIACAGRDGRGVAVAGIGAIAGLLPIELREQAMLGDAGANALGALVGVAFVADPGAVRLPLALALLLGLTAAAEVVSFSQVIDTTPPLHWFDQLGRR
jgi:UDP-GlcNAc:undecaprenyl-phosphate/decaprenyl-phosphate GlcNAc-1-phosphate transferase